MREIVARLRKTGAKLLWASSAPIGKKTEQLGYRYNADAAAYNRVAAKVMAEENIPAIDVYGLLGGDGDKFSRDGVHMTPKAHANEHCNETQQGNLDGLERHQTKLPKTDSHNKAREGE